jgi:hypothetical protein
MAVAILLGGIALLVVGVVATAGAAVVPRRERVDLDEAFAQARSQQAPWSSRDLAALRGEVAAVDRLDPFATLRRVSAPISWHVPSNGNGSEPKRIAWRPPVRTA